MKDNIVWCHRCGSGLAVLPPPEFPFPAKCPNCFLGGDWARAGVQNPRSTAADLSRAIRALPRYDGMFAADHVVAFGTRHQTPDGQYYLAADIHRLLSLVTKGA